MFAGGLQIKASDNTNKLFNFDMVHDINPEKLKSLSFALSRENGLFLNNLNA